MAVIYCFGDSITYGAWDIQGNGWVGRLRKHLDNLQFKDSSLYFLMHNLGIPGETTDGLAKRFESEFKAREDKDEENIFIFAYGANDSAFIPDKNEFGVPNDRFVSNFQRVLNAAAKVSKKIILLNITPSDEEVCAERYQGKKVRLNKNVEDYNKLIDEMAKKNNIPLIDVYTAYNSCDYRKLLSEDGLHPNEVGHQLIFEKVKELL